MLLLLIIASIIFSFSSLFVAVISFCFLVSHSFCCYSSIVSNDISLLKYYTNQVPQGRLISSSFVFFQTSSCLCSLRSICLADSFNTLHCHGLMLHSGLLTYTSTLLSSHTHTQIIQFLQSLHVE